jgi:hypothetical protein
MKLTLLSLLLLVVSVAFAQTDSAIVKKQTAATHADSLRLAKLNSNSNLMLAGGIGLCGVGGFLIYQGNKVYTTPVEGALTNPNYDAQLQQNHRQGTIYMAVGGVAIAGGLVLTAFGIKNKVEFKQRKKLLTAQIGLLDSGNIGLAMGF